MADYFVEGGDVLENKLGITDSEQLHEAEEDVFSDTAADILNEDLSDAILDFNFFKQLHGRLFGKVYPFAGQIRTVNITKQDSSIPFCYADFIEPEANRIFQDLEVKNYLKNETKAEFVDNIAELAMDLNALHPFREGNGRTIRYANIKKTPEKIGGLSSRRYVGISVKNNPKEGLSLNRCSLYDDVEFFVL